MQNKIYFQIEKISLPLIKNFSTDLTKHDKEILNTYKGDFIHITRETGTTIVKLKKYNCTEERDSAKFFLNHYLNEKNHVLILFCNGNTIKKITPEQAREKAQIYFNGKIENITINIEEKTDFNNVIKYVINTNTNSYNEAKKEFLKFFIKDKTIKAESENGIFFL